MDWGNWTPTSENINALPDAIRHYVHDLETKCDPSGLVQENALLKETVESILLRRSAMPEKSKQAEQINKLFLELSQFTTAKTAREIKLENALNELINIFEAWAYDYCNGIDKRTMDKVIDITKREIREAK